MQKGSDGFYTSPTLYDVSGSSDFRNQTHDGFSIYRYFGNDESEAKTVFENLKTKMKFQGEIGGSQEFEYHLPSGRYYEFGTQPPTYCIIDDEIKEAEEKKELPKLTASDAFGEQYNEEEQIPF